ncbi:GNAT family N-acetyltransferase [Streptomyces sp. NPDC048415]|uniref:GNAT family N-acetyltransferase n=1 Tax=Streptomyces sp. NPDC048415 TaxID=3154822 RepID=UPI003434958D
MPTGQQPSAPLEIGAKDALLEQRLDDELTAFNAAATGAGEPAPLSVRVTDTAGELVGGLTAWVRGSCCAVDMLWVREDQRHAGWGSKLLEAAEEESARRGRTEMIVSSFTPGSRLLSPARLPRDGPHGGHSRRPSGRARPQGAESLTAVSPTALPPLSMGTPTPRVARWRPGTSPPGGEPCSPQTRSPPVVVPSSWREPRPG